MDIAVILCLWVQKGAGKNKITGFPVRISEMKKKLGNPISSIR
jgi:hypothetical protein